MIEASKLRMSHPFPRLLAPSKTIHVGNLNVLAGVDIERIDRADFAGRSPSQALGNGSARVAGPGRARHEGVRPATSRDDSDSAELETVARM